MRSLPTEGTPFPYKARSTCLIYIDGTTGEVDQAYTVQERKDVAAATIDGEGRLFGAWPGQWRTDLFALDDLDELHAVFFGDLDEPPKP